MTHSTTRRGFVRMVLTASLVAAGSLLMTVGHSSAQEIGPLTIMHPWARATPPGAKVGGGYLTVENSANEGDRLVSATADVAGRVEIHEMTVVDGVMKMRPLGDGLEVPASGSVELKPGSYHVMMMDLQQPLKEGESFHGTLTFEKAGTVDVTYRIGPIGSSEVPAHDHDEMGHDATDQ